MDDPAEDIMSATFRALCDNGYADLTMRDIAEESDRSKAALHYHYDDREGLMLAFLDHMYEQFTDRVGGYGAGADGTLAESVDADADPDERLRAFLSTALNPPKDGDDVREFRTAMLEIKAQAPYRDAFRARIARFDEFVTDTVTELVEAGQAEGIYRESADPEHVAQFVLVAHDGADARHVIAESPVDCALSSLEDYLDGHLLVDAPAGSESGETDTNDAAAGESETDRNPSATDGGVPPEGSR